MANSVDVMSCVRLLEKNRDVFNSKADAALGRVDSCKSTNPRVVDALMARYDSMSAKADAYAGAVGVLAATLALGMELPSVSSLAAAMCTWAAADDGASRSAMWSSVLTALSAVQAEAKTAADTVERRRSAEADAAVAKAEAARADKRRKSAEADAAERRAAEDHRAPVIVHKTTIHKTTTVCCIF
jgi:hypothetical protein